jgi:hypothetical protein
MSVGLLVRGHIPDIARGKATVTTTFNKATATTIVAREVGGLEVYSALVVTEI